MPRVARDDWPTFAALTAFVVGFLLYLPRAFLVWDEGVYVAQAVAFAQGALTLPGFTPVGEPPDATLSRYPLGTSFLQAPFVLVGGWRAAALASVAALVATTLVLRRWLRDTGSSPGYAILFLGFGGTLVFGRLGMSDLPATALATIALWLLWTPGSRARAGTGGLLAGLGLLVRESNLFLVGPFLAGVVMRRDPHRWWSVAGAITGVGIRAGLMGAVYGSSNKVLYDSDSFGLSYALVNLPRYLLILGVMLPLGLLVPWVYRGPRRTEVRLAFLLVLGLYSCFFYSGTESGGLRGFVLASRYMLPLIPLLVMAGAWTLRDRGVVGMFPRWTPLGGYVVVAASFAIHPIAHRAEESLLGISAAIRQVPDSVLLITNREVIERYLSPPVPPRYFVFSADVRPTDVAALRARFGGAAIALLDRTETPAMAAQTGGNDAFIREIADHCRLTLKHDRYHRPTIRLRVLTVDQCPPGGP